MRVDDITIDFNRTLLFSSWQLSQFVLIGSHVANELRAASD